ncbi:hypothetical protein A1Q2_00396 [Trichosporon asahii var. asahii CBS 8904]|uniref:Uncharacterized protein n=1 Tax=Trichosporon asahii var. asahii (strain CBS 8904) TaxID=1220162 RepID=K1W930_TRIAC|nr:hypothetical protein A1Q2_00396 [Trichosporon asahii var. asahii CBS 8904]
MFKTLAAVSVAVVAQDKPLWKQPEIPTECQGDCIGMLKFQSKCAKADLTCLVELCTCLTCAKADTEEFKNGCKQIQESVAKGSTEIPTGTAADAIAESIIASQSAASAKENGGGAAAATPTESSGDAQASESAAPAAEGEKKDGDASATPTASSGDAQASSGNAPASSGSAAPSGGSATGNAASSGSSAAAAAASKAAGSAGKLAPAALVGAAGLLAALI